MYRNTYSAIINHSVDKIYDLMSDLNSYHLIVPFLKKIIYKDKSVNPINAHIILEYFLIKLEYDCSIYFKPEKKEIEVFGHGYSFENIYGIWKMEKISEKQTRVSYELSFKLKSMIQQKIAEKFFNTQSKKIFDKINNSL
jgi:ribosome-associated toxin RatA of RatAB toxin-antitoxin module